MEGHAVDGLPFFSNLGVFLASRMKLHMPPLLSAALGDECQKVLSAPKINQYWLCAEFENVWLLQSLVAE